MPEDHAFLVRGEDGEEYGPVDLGELRAWVGEGRVGLGTDVRVDVPGELWQPWQYYPELVALLAEVRVIGLSAGGAGPVVAPIGRRVVAGGLDLMLNFALIGPLLGVCFFFLPVDLIIQLYASGFAILQGMSPPPPSPQLPLWFEALLNAIWYGVPTLYYAGFYAAHGRTPAKSIFRLRVVDAHGHKPVFFKALLRSLIFVASVYLFCGIPLIYTFSNPQRRALHDIVAGTYVVEM